MGFIVKSNLQPAYKGIEDMKTALDSMSKIVPTVLAGQGAATLGNRTTYLLNIAYTKQVALKETSTFLMMETAPIMFQRLGCKFTSAGGRAGLGLAAVAAATAAFLSL